MIVDLEAISLMLRSLGRQFRIAATVVSAVALASTLQAKETSVKRDSSITTASDTTWSLTYDDFSAFHLDGTYLTIQSEGSYFLHELIAGKKGREEHIDANRASTKLRAEIGDAIRELNFTKLASPPERTLIPDTVVTKIELNRQKHGQLESITVRFVKHSELDRLNEETSKLLLIIGKFQAAIKKTKVSSVHTQITSPSPRILVSKDQALKSALENGLLATWAEVELHDTYWVISGHSKSANPPMLRVVSAFDGSIVLSKTNTDIEGRQNSFTLTKPSESYDVENLSTTPTWKRRAD
ncbi:hypothetical protein BH10BDE1_BH10BDE1_12640 [soil metagenome]